MKRVVAVIALSLLALACKSKPSQDPGAAPSASAVASAAPSASSSAGPDVSSASGKMAHCPNAVDGATTTFKDVDTGLEITVVAKTDDDVKEVRARAKFLADSAKDDSPSIKHTGKGQGGGQFGRCPVVMKNTTVDAMDIDQGTRITVKVKDPGEVDWLRRESREREDDLSAPGAENAGVGKMGNCPSAVEGATTTLKDTKDGFHVVVTVKGGDDAVKDIRTRASHLADVAKLDPVTIKHMTDGSGGGGLGRCPVLLKDTAVSAKDIPGGSDITVKVTAGDVGLAQKEGHERAVNFSTPPK
jgi:hypothetical protein